MRATRADPIYGAGLPSKEADQSPTGHYNCHPGRGYLTGRDPFELCLSTRLTGDTIQGVAAKLGQSS